ncbi:MAG: hypothetical protein EPGJADBJ_04423 [Saprospiraceae bacterium]|nr:hypothetical protein [Saprospiraceae bacterium]
MLPDKDASSLIQTGETVPASAVATTHGLQVALDIQAAISAAADSTGGGKGTAPLTEPPAYQVVTEPACHDPLFC